MLGSRARLPNAGVSAESGSGVGFVTGAQMASFTALVVARDTLLERHGWDVEAKGLQGAPLVHVVCGACCHGTIESAVRLMGLGRENVRTVPADQAGRIESGALREVLDACSGPVIVCAQAGNVNTGAFDPFGDIVTLARERGAWVHVDGAFGLWAGASDRFEHLVAGVDGADSWATDAHKWLNVPYDSGIVVVRDAEAHRRLKSNRCAYAGLADLEHRDGSTWAPENSRRARGFVLYAALRSLGRAGVRQMVESCCHMARLFAAELSKRPDVQVLNDVVLNQVLFRLQPSSSTDADAFNAAVALEVQKAGECWLGTTRWQGQTVLRVSVSGWSTTKDDVLRSVASLDTISRR